MAENPQPRVAATSVHQSAKMMEAQASFQHAVKQELQVLLTSGLEREVAVKILLHRIVESTEEPEESDVKRVMRQFQMNHDDAVRALIVKQEIGRLKRRGLDAFAAIEELTRKMQQITVPSSDESNEEVEMTVESTEEQVAIDIQNTNTSTTDADDEESKGETMDEGDAEGAVKTRINSQPSIGSENQTADGSQTSLCEQIDQFSISRKSPPPLSTTNPLESSESAFALFSNHSRKRRVATDVSSPTAQSSPSPVIDQQRPTHVFHRPLSPTFRFPTSKKQKLWSEDDISEAPEYDHDVQDLPPPMSPTAVSARNDSAPPSNAPTPTKIGKRRRVIHGTASPELDDLELDEAALVRVTKRQKM